MRIAYVHFGVSIYDHLITKFLADRGHEIHLVSFIPDYLKKFDKTRNSQGFPEFKGLKIHHKYVEQSKIPWVFGYFYNCYKSTALLKKMLREIKPDVLNGHWIPTYGLYSALSGFKPFVLTVWGSDILIAPNESLIIKNMAKMTLRKADRVILDSVVQEKAAVDLNCSPEKIVRFPWAADLKMFNPKVNGRNLRRELGWENKKIVFCARWHSPVYGVEYLMSAVKDIVKEVPDARFLIGGVGELTPLFKNIAKKDNVENFIKFAGRIDYEKMPEYISASDLYVSPSLSDGASSTLLQAMACAKPVAVSNILGNTEWVKDDYNGLLFPVRNPEKIAEKVISLLNDENKMKVFGRRNLVIAGKKADINKNLLKYETALKGAKWTK